MYWESKTYKLKRSKPRSQGLCFPWSLKGKERDPGNEVEEIHTLLSKAFVDHCIVPVIKTKFVNCCLIDLAFSITNTVKTEINVNTGKTRQVKCALLVT